MSEYTDIKGNTYKITNTVLLVDDEKERIENEIIAQLNEIFLRK